ncbi:uncharacterized protein BDZ83DRAFT_642400 [Colletotrichum acutatum]|uniref:Uncharacterized protein n=1 Tax=Glomerella acutata TaxID=27357 RepID=A0AAD8U679_GLOAC|nr:uncharacterized protein BDZ83DRAFT_642400 [Colletotrichum acutatum]KAK1708184.1 hypothetical protein BDZ83DRAFT_642400 [Colletotrichum acutatum]
MNDNCPPSFLSPSWLLFTSFSTFHLPQYTLISYQQHRLAYPNRPRPRSSSQKPNLISVFISCYVPSICTFFLVEPVEHPAQMRSFHQRRDQIMLANIPNSRSYLGRGLSCAMLHWPNPITLLSLLNPARGFLSLFHSTMEVYRSHEAPVVVGFSSSSWFPCLPFTQRYTTATTGIANMPNTARALARGQLLFSFRDAPVTIRRRSEVFGFSERMIFWDNGQPESLPPYMVHPPVASRSQPWLPRSPEGRISSEPWYASAKRVSPSIESPWLGFLD